MKLKNPKKPYQVTWFWLLVFGLCFGLSLDFWRWSDSVQLGVGGLPTWIWYFVVLQLLLTVLIGVFTKVFWKD